MEENWRSEAAALGVELHALRNKGLVYRMAIAHLIVTIAKGTPNPKQTADTIVTELTGLVAGLAERDADPNLADLAFTEAAAQIQSLVENHFRTHGAHGPAAPTD